uniref:Tctex1 domain containing 2 n=1 Tax=Pelusios castaneus TaxID=367368 RepID=A0A8C8RTS2_9SAUR
MRRVVQSTGATGWSDGGGWGHREHCERVGWEIRSYWEFRSSTVKECIHAILKENLANVQYDPEETPQLTRSLSETIKDRLKEEGFYRYKMVVQVVIGEQRGEGVNMAARCFWDSDTDNYAQDIFMNDSLFCVVAAFGCFYY